MLDGSYYFECKCGAIDHSIRFVANLDDEPEIFIDAFLEKPSLKDRLINAYKWFFGKDLPFGLWGGTIFQDEDIPEMEKVLLRIINKPHKNNNARANSLNHVFSLHVYKDNYGVELHSRIVLKYQSVLKDSWAIIKYIFGYTSPYGAWDNFIVTPAAAANMLHTINEYRSMKEER